MPQKNFPDSNTMKDFHKMPQKNFPDSNTMKDFHKMPQKDFPDFTTMKDFHNPESESTFTAFSGFSNHSRILRHFAAFSTSIKKLEDFESSGPRPSWDQNPGRLFCSCFPPSNRVLIKGFELRSLVQPLSSIFGVFLNFLFRLGRL